MYTLNEKIVKALYMSQIPFGPIYAIPERNYAHVAKLLEELVAKEVERKEEHIFQTIEELSLEANGEGWKIVPLIDVKNRIANE